VVEKKSLGVFLPPSALNSDVPPILDEIIEKMMARDPRDRYQTASELIIDLERSRLASPVLSFADLALAMQDPAAQKYLASSGEPTRLDMVAAATSSDVWFLRYRAPDGTWRKVRATTKQIVKRLRGSGLPKDMEAARQDQGDDFRPLEEYAEFRGVTRRRTRRLGSRRKRVPAVAGSRTFSRRRWALLLMGGAALVAFALVIAVLILCLREV
jgi:hypothetical protein